MSDDRCHLIEEFAAVDLADLRRAVGSRAKFRKLDALTVHLPGRDVVVHLARGPSNIPGGEIVFATCPRCQGNARVLRIAPVPEGLLCSPCLRRVFKAKYASQKRSRYSRRASVRTSSASSEAEPRDAGERTP